jgi:glycine/D-amino acid oxidase-like deaminating enzyme
MSKPTCCIGSVFLCQHIGAAIQVLLRHKDAEGRALVHATSWWNAAAASSNLRDPSQPIWVSLTQAHKELYREIQTVQLGSSAALEQHFGENCMFWWGLYALDLKS